MSGRPTFGDFASIASAHLEQAVDSAGLHGRRRPSVAAIANVDEFSQSLRGLITVMARYSADVEGALLQALPHQSADFQRWLRASSRTHEALRTAADFLSPLPGQSSRRSNGAARSPIEDQATKSVAGAATALTTGRNLLQTHLAVSPDGSAQGRSEWARVITSGPVARAQLLEMASWARQVAPLGGRLATAPPPARGSAEARRRVNAACQWLWVLDWAVQAAHEHDPVRVADQRLLHAIPVNAIEPRQQPVGPESIGRLCEGTIDTAERVRRIARTAAADAAWSPSLTTDSLRETASCATVISHNCQVVLSTLAGRVGERGSTELKAELTKAAESAGAARQAWLDAGRQWRSITTDARGATSRVAAETYDLALWTGQMAYHDPAWTPQQGPSRAIRRPEDLAAGPADLTGAVAAVHHACETLTQLAEAEHRRAATAAEAGRLLVPTRSLPEGFDVPRIYAPAPDSRVEMLLTTYRNSEAASADVTSDISAVAAKVRSPSRSLTAARAAVQGSEGNAREEGEAAEAVAESRGLVRDLPGPVERIMHELGVTSLELLDRAVELDNEGDKLVRQAAAQQSSVPSGRSMSRNPSRSAATAELINHLLASDGDRKIAAVLLPAPQRVAEPEIEP